jgi:uncharacterized peroxidase-related enzyme
VTHHGAGLLRLTKNKELVGTLSAGADWPGLSAADRAMLSYARKLTTDIAGMGVGDVQKLRQLGFSDRQILEINLAAAYMNFVNRVAEGLGVELEASTKDFTR